MSPKPLEIAKQVKKLASLPEVCIKVNQLADDPHASTQDIKTVIETDVALTAQILRVANSSFYPNASKVADVNRAIMLIGTQGLRDILWASSAISSFKALSNKFVEMSTFWSHSLYVATVARVLAGKCRIIHKDRLFLSGLLHDVGHLALYQTMPDEMEAVFALAQGKQIPIQVAEKKVLDFTHAAVSYALLKLWRIPDSVCRAAAYHHAPGSAKEYRLESAILHIADEISKMAGVRGTHLEMPVNIDPIAWEISGLNEKIMDSVIQVSEQQYAEAMSLYFKVDNATNAA